MLLGLPDGPEFVAALFGTLRLGAVGVMVNPGLPAADLEHLLQYARAKAVVTHRETAPMFEAAARAAPLTRAVLVVGDDEFDRRLAAAPPSFETFPSHRDDAALWLFSGGTTGRPKAVIQTHRSFVNTTECYARQVIGYGEDDVTLSVPKLYFGYATGSNLFFPFAAGASAVLFPEPPTPETMMLRRSCTANARNSAISVDNTPSPASSCRLAVA